jgi:hypothetical protein
MSNANPSLAERIDAAQLVDEWVREFAQANDGELPDWLEELQMVAHDQVRDKIKRVGRKVLSLNADVETIDREIARLKGRRDARANGAERLKRYLDVCLTELGEAKVVDPFVTVARQKNGGQERITWDHADADNPELEIAFAKAYRPEPDMQKVRQHYNTHGRVPEGFTVHPRGESIRVK